jgi:hypothetical protein
MYAVGDLHALRRLHGDLHDDPTVGHAVEDLWPTPPRE